MTQLILVTICSFCLFNVGAISQATTDQFSTYKNEIEGFTIDYPTSWNIDENSTHGGQTSLVSFSPPETYFRDTKVEIFVTDVGYEESAEQNLVKRLISFSDVFLAKQRYLVESLNATDLSGLQSFSLLWTDEGLTTNELWGIYGQKMYTLKYSSSVRSSFDSFYPSFRTMLKSFEIYSLPTSVLNLRGNDYVFHYGSRNFGFMSDGTNLITAYGRNIRFEGFSNLEDGNFSLVHNCVAEGDAILVIPKTVMPTVKEVTFYYGLPYYGNRANPVPYFDVIFEDQEYTAVKIIYVNTQGKTFPEENCSWPILLSTEQVLTRSDYRIIIIILSMAALVGFALFRWFRGRQRA